MIERRAYLYLGSTPITAISEIRLRADLPFLERLGDELTRPVLPQSAALDYTPSQYLCGVYPQAS